MSGWPQSGMCVRKLSFVTDGQEMFRYLPFPLKMDSSLRPSAL